MSEAVLVVAAHPDDEVLGCGGAVAKHVDAGDKAHVLIVAEGGTSRDSRRDTKARSHELDALQDAACKAATVLGTEAPIHLGLPDNRLDVLQLLDIIKPISEVVDRIKPSIVYTHHAHDLNIDHRVVHQAVITACRPLPDTSVKAIYAFETMSSTEWQSGGPGFRPTRWVNVSVTMDRKMAALAEYQSEMRPFPHARSREAILALAKLRGAMAGLPAAEAFEVVMSIDL